MMHTQRRGAIALITIVFISAFALAVMVTSSLSATRGLDSASITKTGEKTLGAAEAGVQDALYRLGFDSSAGSYTTTFNGIALTITITPNGFVRTIRSSSHDPQTDTSRTITINVNTSSLGGNINSAVQTGAGGLQIDNGGIVNGDVLIGDTSGSGTVTSQNNASFNGNLFVSGASGLADGVTTTSNHDIHSHVIKNSTAGGKAYYRQLQGNVKAAAGNDTCSNGENGPNCFDNSTDPAPLGFPITTAAIQTLATQITNAGTTITTCDVNGNYTITDAQPLPSGSAKIACNLVFNTNNVSAPITLNGNLWVTGDISFTGNNQTLQLPTSANGKSAFIISGDPFANPTTVKGKITITNNVNIIGSEHGSPAPSNPKDYIFFLSMSNLLTDANPAIAGSNNSSAAVYYAPNGLILVSNGAVLNNTTAKKIHINNATINFTSGLSQFVFGPTVQAPPVTLPDTWQEL